jgi:transcription elongation factor GreA
MYDPGEDAEAIDRKKPQHTEHGRMRRESRPESGIGAHINSAASDADARVLRAIAGPPPTEAEAQLIATAAREPVRMFTRVLVTDLETGEQERYTIVPHDEGNLEAGRITVGSPLGRGLLEEYPGSLVAVKTPGGKRLYRILQVEV